GVFASIGFSRKKKKRQRRRENFFSSPLLILLLFLPFASHTLQVSFFFSFSFSLSRRRLFVLSLIFLFLFFSSTSRCLLRFCFFLFLSLSAFSHRELLISSISLKERERKNLPPTHPHPLFTPSSSSFLIDRLLTALSSFLLSFFCFFPSALLPLDKTTVVSFPLVSISSPFSLFLSIISFFLFSEFS
ncbi:hypothetical protein CSUI_006780, partial [Cystoisospora suis]